VAKNTVEVKAERLRIFLKHLEKGVLNTQPLMQDIGGRLELSILKRTAEGKDAEGNPFIEYSKEYARIRELVGAQTDPVNLFFGGSMLGALTHESEKDSAKLFFMNTPHIEHVKVPGHKKKKSGKVTNAELAYYNDEVRPFFSISAEEQQMVLKMVDEFIDELMEG